MKTKSLIIIFVMNVSHSVLYILYDTRSIFLLNRTKFILMHKLLPGLLPRLHQVCGKMFSSQQMVLLWKLLFFINYFISFLYILFCSILFYSIFKFQLPHIWDEVLVKLPELKLT